jgi:hypothetical protein
MFLKFSSGTTDRLETHLKNTEINGYATSTCWQSSALPMSGSIKSMAVVFVPVLIIAGFIPIVVMG